MTETIRTDNSETLKNALLKIKALEEQVEKLQDKIEYEQSINDQKQSEINLKYREIIELQEQIEKMKCCENCQTVRDVNGNCYLHKDGECDPKTKIKWELAEN